MSPDPGASEVARRSTNAIRHSRPITIEHTNDDWDDDDDDDGDDGDDDAGGYQHVEGIASPDSIRPISEGSLSSEDAEIDFSDSSSMPMSTTLPQSPLEPGRVFHIAVRDTSSSPQMGHANPPSRCCISADLDYLLFPVHVSSVPELYTSGSVEMVQLSDVFDVHKQTKARPVVIATASLGYVRGIIFPASTLLKKSGSHSFQTLFYIETDSPMPKGTSGSAMFDAETGLLAGHLVLGCPGKHTFYMASILDVLDELSILFGSIARCHVQLNVSAIVEMPPGNSALANPTFPVGGLHRSILHQPLESVTAVTIQAVHHQPDDWTKRFGHKAKLLGPGEDRAILDTLREHMPGFSEVRIFMSTDPKSPDWEHTVSRVERFCEGASFALDRSVPDDAENSRFKDIQEPRAWVSDQKWAPEGLQPQKRVHGGPLDCIELHNVLQRKCLRDDALGDKIGPPRRIYINNPSGASVLALIRAIPASQVEGLRKLLTDYITSRPAPMLRLQVSSRLGGCFNISFTIPYYGIGTKDLQDARNISNGNSRLRPRYDLDFLHLKNYESGGSRNEASFFSDQVLHEAIYSLTVTGKSDKYWTATCLDDDFFLEEPRLPTQEEDYDPIIREKIMPTTTPSPRSYALASLLATSPHP
ncbi:hypothetical protein MRS44_002007 [Fusarium solani]|uniref:uncharacterized protein n=1 Tax=Fusarium solani TaxID=169388 RepID=UPI0032C3DB24|nr:hypothetical protein MRS44_002007 [Fusarium solani]